MEKSLNFVSIRRWKHCLMLWGVLVKVPVQCSQIDNKPEPKISIRYDKQTRIEALTLICLAKPTVFHKLKVNTVITVPDTWFDQTS